MSLLTPSETEKEGIQLWKGMLRCPDNLSLTVWVLIHIGWFALLFLLAEYGLG